ncbi:MAG TPA: hypothetical protein PLO37_03200 [Candidatus Hydrogenedentes bacterium]|nr:hypothetical protein [Candidatus Hydrogenedentota bacterium]HPG65826.1 hypothetical protein [Candidatus Hydrogenedentota bacterium]
MDPMRAVPRRGFLNLSAAVGLGATVLDGLAAYGEAPGAPDPDRPPAALSSIRLLADLFVEWQMDIGRLDPRLTGCATWGAKRNSYPRWATALNEAYRATGVEAYRAAADRLAVFYLGCLCDAADFHPPHFALGMVMYREIKRNHPQVADFDDKVAALFEWMKTFEWEEGSCYRNGYPGGDMPDAGNSCDTADVGNGLMAYYTVKERPDVLAAAERLAQYFLSEVEPGTYHGVWSSRLGTWVVAPTTQAKFEHFDEATSCEVAWGYTSIIAISYLTRLAQATADEPLRAGIAEKCAASMKWQFDACQFEDGACGMSGRDDKWLGMTAGAILSYVRVRDAGYLSDEDIAHYRPRALDARDWLLRNISAESLRSPTAGYFPAHGTSHPGPPDNVSWNLAYALEASLSVEKL